MTAFSILGTRFTIASERSELLRYVQHFMGAYDRQIEDVVSRDVAIVVSTGALPSQAAARIAPVHRSKHEYWNFDAHWLAPTPVAVWPTRGVAITLTPDGADVVAGLETPPAVAGEAVFHLCRSLALYRREAESRNFLHASAVLIGGTAMLFCGGSSSGKTTLLTHMVAEAGARPLANDRVTVSAGPSLLVTSWPSYASYCEGTLLDYAPLRAAAEEYEADTCVYRTLSWSHPLQPHYDKVRKRIYPMGWFAKAFGVTYARTAPLGALIFPNVSPSSDRGLTEWNLDSAAVRAELVESLALRSFDRSEPSFLPWHGLSLPEGAPPLSALVDALHAARIPVYSLDCRPRDYHPLMRLMEAFA